MPAPLPLRVSLLLLLLQLSVLSPVVHSQPACTATMAFDGEPDLPGSPLEPPLVARGAYEQACGWLCHAEPACGAWVWYALGTGAVGRPLCALPRGCCNLKPRGSWLNATFAKSACGAVMRHPPSTFPPAPSPASPPSGAKNVLHIIVDDLRPDLAPFGPAFMHTPHLSALASSATLFSRAHCNIAVCSPSRLSFLTGRRPATARSFNFVNHFRQSTCAELPGTAIAGRVYATINIPNGGAGQCCSHCTADSACAAWELAKGVCSLKARAGARSAEAGVVSGVRGTTATREWTSMPQAFYNAGYSTFGVGKIFHTEEGGNGPLPWDGGGMPPLQDPPSWSRAPNATFGDVNAMAPMYPGDGEPGDADGTPTSNTTKPFEDRVIGDAGVLLLRELGAARAAGGAPFYLAVGFRKPHLPFRHPDFYDAMYAPQSSIAVAKHGVLDKSIPPIAFHQADPIVSPYTPVDVAVAQSYRFNYYAAISWIDHQVGQVLAELDATGLANDTLVVFHADVRRGAATTP